MFQNNLRASDAIDDGIPIIWSHPTNTFTHFSAIDEPDELNIYPFVTFHAPWSFTEIYNEYHTVKSASGIVDARSENIGLAT